MPNLLGVGRTYPEDSRPFPTVAAIRKDPLGPLLWRSVCLAGAGQSVADRWEGHAAERTSRVRWLPVRPVRRRSFLVETVTSRCETEAIARLRARLADEQRESEQQGGLRGRRQPVCGAQRSQLAPGAHRARLVAGVPSWSSQGMTFLYRLRITIAIRSLKRRT
jgi:hypothetical protein